ncbi:DHH family phosphoesterase [Aliarcobacter thereius]|uniref:Bifunctional oligoribonuclease and PAP phosphatase NrnA n=1 Tax=Aliarcobacter thereius LMG 24486 TaxID=1032240 RepID=A0A1C7WNA9_9BACT|nr:bifunctional oligoribonuclease/PAP phosphatase NrnA [Aliarcobacter thereius]OCL92131.1 Bifunctional oligoribonuclease and PAP phosphatase NrnA [Aliarcobacter thereius]OCL94773.1 Bifunctional oligoribonuclease and PAP phosphatase NrnA [Aliarcobacter thereius LMG 24486]QBF15351.1 nanoRNase / pAp phosphatase [Aliarcobacter thereius LMG 24486]TLS93168.1 bifunctional oligoribonuclease/PAP phosphatase NrnA [Aliarcobacter thereius]HJE03632.1 bifunctional oligoribonuclease/PAP phosphatase NrnA [Ali
MISDFTLKNQVDTNKFLEALELIKKSRYILLITHVNPDPDSIGSALAISNLLFENKIKHKVYNISSDLPQSLDFLNRFEKMTNVLPAFFDLAISFDCGTYKRLGFELDKSIPLINFDHHASNENFGDVNIVDPYKSSTAELVFDFFKYNGLNISKNSAEALYVGIYDDTLAFSLPRCDQETFKKINFLVESGANPSYITNKLLRRDSLAKYRIIPKVLDSLSLYNEGKIASIIAIKEWFEQTGAHARDCEDALDMIMSIGVVEIAFFIRYINDKCRISLRSKGKINVSKIASIFDGGGHFNAAGCTIETNDVEEAKNLLLKEIKKYYA